MRPQKRIRACEACHELKIKCETPGTADKGAACARCQRMRLNCVPSPPRLQRDRIADLEAQVEALKIALSGRDGRVPEPQAPALTSASRPTGGQGVNEILAYLDMHTSKDDQSRALEAYSRGFKSVWCPVNLSTHTLDNVREDSPLLLLTIVAFPMAAEACGNSIAKANELVNGATDLLARRTLAEGAQNQEMVRALLTAAFWHRIPRGEVTGHCHQYSRLAIDMAIDIGLGGPAFPGSPAVYFRRMDGHEDNDSGRTWLACYASASMYGLNVRRPATVLWSKQHETSLRSVESNGRFEDRLFCQITLLISLCQQAAEEFELCDFAAFHDIDSESCQKKMALLMDRFRHWELSVSQDLLAHPMVRFWSCIFTIYLHEVVLHTPTNKLSFAAPHVPANLPVSDFSAPQIVTIEAAAAMRNLIAACHGAIVACEDMGPAEVLAAPSAVFAPAVMYALKVLVHVFITVNGPGSTFGGSNLIAKNDVRMRQYIEKVMAISKNVEAATYIDTYWTGRILGASSWLTDWANDYEVILRRYAEKQRIVET